MGSLDFHVFVLLIFAYCLRTTFAASCEETETAHVKLDLAKQSISNAKLLFPKCENETDSSNCSIKDKSLGHLNAALDLISEAKITCHSCPESKVIVIGDAPIDCSDVRSKDVNKKSGVYKIWPKVRGVYSGESFDVYCDMETDGGGWTVIQRRGDFPVRTNFSQGWEAYKKGFGDIQQEFWLGNDKMSILTNQGMYSGRFDLIDVRRLYKYAIYSSFSIGDEKSDYVLRFDKHTGNATDDMRPHLGNKFSTKDKQNDGRPINDSCIKTFERSAFWFNEKCGLVSLNGIYQPGVKDQKGILWYSPAMDYECLYSVEIKIRREDA